MTKPAKIFITLIILGAIAGGGYYYWNHKQSGAQETAAAGAPGAGGPPGGMPVEAEKVVAREFTVSINAVGSLIAGESADIHSEIAGQIEKIQFEEGQPVKKGDVLMQIDRSLIQTELSKAKAAYDATSATFSRDDKLKESGYVSNQKWDLSKSDLQTSKSAVENARIRLEKTSVRAPFDGVAGLRSFSVGDYAQIGQVLTTIDSINPLKLEFSVPERNYSAVQTGQKITFSVDAWPGETFEGEIYAIDPRINPDTRNFNVKANIQNNENRLRPGMYSRISIATITRQNVLMIAEEAIMPQGEKSFVYTIVDGKATMTQVTPGIRDNGRVEITAGLNAGDEVITAGTMRIGPGAPVMVLPSADQQAAGQPPAAEPEAASPDAAPASEPAAGEQPAQSEEAPTTGE